jgi:flagellar basal body-associated protein FliL
MADQAQTSQPANQDTAPAVADTSTPVEAAKPLTRPVLLSGLLVMLLTPTAGYYLTTLSMPPRHTSVHAELLQEAQLQTEKLQKAQHAEVATFPLSAMQINIYETRGTRILKLVPHLQLSESQMASKLPPLKALLMDTIATVVCSKKLDELEGPAARESLKKTIILRLNEQLAKHLSGSIVDIYFEEFLLI